MTNPKTRKTGTPPDARHQQHQQQHHRRDAERSRVQVTIEDDVSDQFEGERQCLPLQEDLHTQTASDVDEIDNAQDEEDDEEEDRDSSSSFSLQECFNEFRARRIRRISTQSREAAPVCVETGCGADGVVADPADVDLINQNRSNKEYERKCKPCQNGFCYCFTSDSGEGGAVRSCDAAARGAHVRQPRRSRKSESSQFSYIAPQRHTSKSKERRRQSAPATLKAPPQKLKQQKPQKLCDKIASSSSVPKRNTPAEKQLTAISRLETTSNDAPLIHIIQELRNNCVISEVRVNKHKMQAAQERQQRSRSLNTSKSSSPKKTHFQLNQHSSGTIPPQTKCVYNSAPQPSAPNLEKISEIDSQLSETSQFIVSSPLDTSSKSNDSAHRHRHKSAGLLLQKRLSQSQIHFKPRNLNQPPPKPPRSSIAFEDARKSSISTLTSTSSSLREAERVLDDFLRKRGIKVPGEVEQQQSLMCEKTSPRHRVNSKIEKSAANEEARRSANAAAKREKRKSYSLTHTDQKMQFQEPLPTCPSLSDIERVIDSKKSTNYEKNIRQVASGNKPVKELSFGWNEPKINEMLNCDINAKRDKFETQAKHAQPQSSGRTHSIGWQIPPKIDLDTVDSSVLQHNLASNIDEKDTPVKTRLFAGGAGASRNKHDSQKFIWGEQLRNLSPWTNKRVERISHQHKSNLKSASSSFIKSSKKKILRLVSPKKDNKQARPFQAPRKTPLRTVGVQTSREDLQRSYENSSNTTPLSPPGSYHSVEPTLAQQSSTTISSISPAQPFSVDVETQFDFSRIVQSPPKQKTSSSRKLNFPLNCSTGGGGVSCLSNNDAVDGESSMTAPNMTKTYRSFHSDLDQDVTLSKMGYILGNIRAKLEASDEHAIKTFQEIERREQRVTSFDIPDSHNLRQQTRVDIHPNVAAARRRYMTNDEELHDPIYSEIEEDSIHFSGSPQFDNKTASGKVQHFASVLNPEALYAKVNKASKLQSKPSQPTALGKLLHDSMRHVHSRTPTTQLPPVPEPTSGSDTFSNSSPARPSHSSHTPRLSHCQSLNNIRVMEHHSPPKLNRNLNKSDLSLQRSEIFLENLCRSEIIVEAGELDRLEKVDNHNLNRSGTSIHNHGKHPQDDDVDDDYDSVSYELPHDGADTDSYSIAAGGSNLGISTIAPPHSHNQSTPKKTAPTTQSFMTKRFQGQELEQTLNVDISSDCINARHLLQNHSSSCPTTPHQLPPPSLLDGSIAVQKKIHAASMDEVRSESVLQNKNTTNPLTVSTLARYKRLKTALRKSFRKSKNFVKSETKRLSTSLSLPMAPHTATASSSRYNQSDAPTAGVNSASVAASTLNLDTLFALDESVPVAQQLAKAVSICRQLPDLEISPEMVEAERLLLFSSLRRSGGTRKQFFDGGCRLEQRRQRTQRRYFIDAMRLPVRPAASQDLFFNYFYIGAFECDGVIRSTQSVECRNNVAIFNDCGIEFACGAPEEVAVMQDVAEVRCDIFMLRLRKVSTLSLEPHKSIVRFQGQELEQTLNVDISSDCINARHLLQNHSSSCPTTPHQLPPPSLLDGSIAVQKKIHAASMDEVRSESVLQNKNTTNPLTVSTLARYKRLKTALRKSFRKSKNFVKSETKRLSTSLSLPMAPHTATASSSRYNQSDAPTAGVNSASVAASTLNLDTLFALDESVPVAQQLAKAVSICRQLPDLEISPEMVEAERLLLFSSLRRSGGTRKQFFDGGCRLEQRRQRTQRRYFIDAMRLPVRPAASQDLFFNYFYIGAFECDGVIRSTQSVECRNNVAIFNDCGIEFACGAPEEVAVMQDVAEVRCDIFMLRLRKVSTLSLEPHKSIVKLPQPPTPSPTTSSSSSVSRDEVVSRFRLHASFTLKASDFAPFDYVASESKNNDHLCIRASGSCSIPLMPRTKSTNLSSEIVLEGRAEARFAKRKHSGFLNVQEPHSQHNWNRRWCTLDGLHLLVWQDANDLQEQPMLCLDLRDNVPRSSPLDVAPRDLCARPRSFCLQCTVSKVDDRDAPLAVAAVFFAADTQADLVVWLQQLNAVLDFVVAWLQ